MTGEICRFSVWVDCSGKPYEDQGILLLPRSYRAAGEKTPLVINCHGAGGTVTTDDSQVESQALTRYLLANGYGVMDVNGLPERYAEEQGIDLRNNIGSPIAVKSYVTAYRYCTERFNLSPAVFVHGSSMGGISSTNLVLSGQIPVVAHTAFCPVLDTYRQIFLHPWCDGLPKTAMGKLYGLEQTADGEYIYNEAKLAGYNPVETLKERKYPVPVAFWHCEDDPVVPCEITKEFVRTIRESGGSAALTLFPRGGHEPQLVGNPVEQPAGLIQYDGGEIPVTAAVEGVFSFYRQFGERGVR